jgi:hypothetical protein
MAIFRHDAGVRLKIRDVIIDEQEEFTRDWDWYAVDQDGHIGHFTSAGMRLLPKSVKQDRETTEAIARYFFEQAPVVGKWAVRPEAEADCGGWKKQGFERYIRDFALMASKGLFSFDTDLIRTEKGRYYLVAVPERILLVNDLPLDIGELVSRICVPLHFIECNYIHEPTTAAW